MNVNPSVSFHIAFNDVRVYEATHKDKPPLKRFLEVLDVYYVLMDLGFHVDVDRSELICNKPNHLLGNAIRDLLTGLIMDNSNKLLSVDRPNTLAKVTKIVDGHVLITFKHKPVRKE